tara:strand:- start:5994 stop:6863 length:870 start_codon:yes stop_codon:yes gene_type:complete
MSLSLTAIVLTLNEETNLAGCLKSLSWCPRLVVVDSGSSDSTQQIARQYGADFYLHSFDGPFLITDQRNWALSQCSVDSEWVLFIDADERVSHALQKEICGLLNSNHAGDSPRCDACYLAPAYIFCKKWLRHSQHYPNWHPRLLRPSRVQLTGGVWESFSTLTGRPLNPERITSISEPYTHIAFSKGIDDWLFKHLRYADWDASLIINYFESKSNLPSMLRKPRLRTLSFRLWFLRPLLRFFYKYFFSLGFLDGWQGLLFCLLMSYYELIVVLKVVFWKQHSSSTSSRG